MAFGAPLFLIGLLALPAIWWLLRVTPPLPRKEIFPPLNLLLKIKNRQETPNRTPWWLLFLRLAIAAFVIIALSDPIWQPKPVLFTSKEPLIIMIDNGWASVHNWDKQVEVAENLLDQAQKLQKKVYVVTTANSVNEDMRALSVDEAKKLLANLRPLPLPTDRFSTIKKLVSATNNQPADIAFLSDGLQTPEDDNFLALIAQYPTNNIVWYQENISELIGITAIKNENGATTVDLTRSTPANEKNLTLGAYDRKGRRIADTHARFEDGETATIAAFNLPLELKNDVTTIKIDEQNDSASTYLIDSRNHTYRVAILSTSPNEMTQPLLSPLYYVTKALQGHADLVMAGTGNFSNDVEKLLVQNPSTFILGDVVNMPKDIETKLKTFVENGGTLIRFAGDNLANATDDDSLLPVQLRHGERQLGGVMSWASPQKLAPFTKNSLFSDIPFPNDVTISRQILAEPSPQLFDRTLLSLADGTPLITAANMGKGKIIFVHTSADPSWSSLPLSGFFVEMLEKLISISSLTNEDATKNNENIVRKPWRVLDATGTLIPPESYVSPLVLDENTPALPSYNHPPGFYGSENNLYAVNLLDSQSTLQNLAIPVDLKNVHQINYTSETQLRLVGPLLGIALILFILDSLIVLGVSRFFAKHHKLVSVVLMAATLVALININQISPLYAQDLSPNDKAMVESAGKTRLAYVITGNNEIDDTSKTGLESLNQFIKTRTTIDPGPVAGLDLDKDELAFYPLIYWPIDATAPMPTQKAIEKIDAFMHQGGAVLFDTRDQMTAGMDLKGAATPNTQRLRDILDGLNIPALEQTPPDHVLSRSFFIMPDFPGRFRGSPLWISSSAMGSNDKRPIHAGDGVSSILITANDLAGAWAHDGKGAWKYPLIPDDQMQRIWAFRGGLNIVMYILTGNYKADQVHVPALLERLGQERAQ